MKFKTFLESKHAAKFPIRVITHGRAYEYILDVDTTRLLNQYYELWVNDCRDDDAVVNEKLYERLCRTFGFDIMIVRATFEGLRWVPSSFTFTFTDTPEAEFKRYEGKYVEIPRPFIRAMISSYNEKGDIEFNFDKNGDWVK